MIRKLPKSWVRFGLKVGVAGAVLELSALLGTYIFWKKLNSDQGKFQYEDISLKLSLLTPVPDLFKQHLDIASVQIIQLY